MLHVLKLESKYYDASLTNAKTFEIRKNDRDFKVGDIIKLVEVNQELRNESNPVGSTGRAHYRKITYIFDDMAYLRDGYVCLGLTLCDEDLSELRDILGIIGDMSADRLRELVQAERAELPAVDWVCVTERLPEKEGEYLFYTKFDEMFVAHICKDELDPDSWVIDADYTPSSITHWRLIPEPPKEKS